MPFRQRTIIGIVVDGDGSPVVNGEVKFQPTEKLAYTATHIIVDAVFTVQTNNDGDFTIDIWCDEDSLVPVNYNVFFPTEDGGQAKDEHRASFSLEYGDGSPINLAELINASVPAPTPEMLLYEFINQAAKARTNWTPLLLTAASTLTAAQSGSMVLADVGAPGYFVVTLPVTDLIPFDTRFAFRTNGISLIGVNGGVGGLIYANSAGDLASGNYIEPADSGEGFYLELLYVGEPVPGEFHWQGVCVNGKWIY